CREGDATFRARVEQRQQADCARVQRWRSDWGHAVLARLPYDRGREPRHWRACLHHDLRRAVLLERDETVLGRRDEGRVDLDWAGRCPHRKRCGPFCWGDAMRVISEFVHRATGARVRPGDPCPPLDEETKRRLVRAGCLAPLPAGDTAGPTETEAAAKPATFPVERGDRDDSGRRVEPASGR